MRLSIGMKTYNGLPYLQEQLESILGQTRLPDEVVVCDDGSTDGSWEALRAFQQAAPFEVRLERNAENLGPAANGAKAASLCTGDIVFLSDHDDVSLPGKLESFEQAFARQPEALLAIADSVVVDERLDPKGYNLWHAHGFTPALQELFLRCPLQVLLQANQATSGAMAVRREVLQHVVPVPRRWAHDGWIALVAATLGDVTIVTAPAQLYRQHEANIIPVVPAVKKTVLRKMKGKVRFAMEARKRLAALAEYWAPLVRLQPLVREPARREDVLWGIRRRDHYRARSCLPRNMLRRLQVVKGEIKNGNYELFSDGRISAAKDLLIP